MFVFYLEDLVPVYIYISAAIVVLCVCVFVCMGNNENVIKKHTLWILMSVIKRTVKVNSFSLRNRKKTEPEKKLVSLLASLFAKTSTLTAEKVFKGKKASPDAMIWAHCKWSCTFYLFIALFLWIFPETYPLLACWASWHWKTSCLLISHLVKCFVLDLCLDAV